jgi:hypothetical protein
MSAHAAAAGPLSQYSTSWSRSGNSMKKERNWLKSSSLMQQKEAGPHALDNLIAAEATHKPQTHHQ